MQSFISLWAQRVRDYVSSCSIYGSDFCSFFGSKHIDFWLGHVARLTNSFCLKRRAIAHVKPN
jgi:hypothetical protein